MKKVLAVFFGAAFLFGADEAGCSRVQTPGSPQSRIVQISLLPSGGPGAQSSPLPGPGIEGLLLCVSGVRAVGDSGKVQELKIAPIELAIQPSSSVPVAITNLVLQEPKLKQFELGLSAVCLSGRSLSFSRSDEKSFSGTEAMSLRFTGTWAEGEELRLDFSPFVRRLARVAADSEIFPAVEQTTGSF